MRDPEQMLDLSLAGSDFKDDGVCSAAKNNLRIGMMFLHKNLLMDCSY
jgi:hypothetical protein